MTSKDPDTIVITGATGAIGAALAHYYARPGAHLILQGRNQEKLDQVSEHCRAAGARVTETPLDLCDRDALTQWLDDMFARSVPELVFANAGMNIDTGPKAEGETWSETEQLLELNVRSTCYLAHRMATAMREQGRGHLVLISSLAAWFGLPVTPAYSASKAAVKAYGEGLKGWLEGSGVAVTVVMPGYVSSAMCHAMPGPKPFLWQPEKAARTIANSVAKKRSRISFPFPLNWGCWWLAVLPAGISHRLVRLFGYGD